MDPLERTAQYEGFRSQRYLDSKGNPTIGYGHKILPGEKLNRISEQQARDLLATEWGQKVNEFYKNVPEAHNYPQQVQEAMWDMAYNMGPNFIDKFPKAKQHLDNSNYTAAALEFASGSKPGTSSKYVQDTGSRALENIRRIMAANAPATPGGNWEQLPDGSYRLTMEKRGLGGFNQ